MSYVVARGKFKPAEGVGPAGKPFPGDEAPLRVQDLAVDPFDALKLYAATEDGLYQTRDRGASWQQVGLDGYFVFALAVDPFRPGALFASAYRKQGGQEAELLKGLPAGAAAYSVAVDPHRQDVVYAGLQGQVYRSLDAGCTWRPFGNGLPADAAIVDLLPPPATSAVSTQWPPATGCSCRGGRKNTDGHGQTRTGTDRKDLSIVRAGP